MLRLLLSYLVKFLFIHLTTHVYSYTLFLFIWPIFLEFPGWVRPVPKSKLLTNICDKISGCNNMFIMFILCFAVAAFGKA